MHAKLQAETQKSTRLPYFHTQAGYVWLTRKSKRSLHEFGIVLDEVSMEFARCNQVGCSNFEMWRALARLRRGVNDMGQKITSLSTQ